MGLQLRPGFDGYGSRGRRKASGGAVGEQVRPARSGARRAPKADSGAPGPRLRLVGAGDARLASWRGVADASQTPAEELLAGPTDPRWVLAARTTEVLEGAVLPPQRRERLIRLGGVLGLSVFDANLVIAIVQDQARRGYPKESILGQAEGQLRMVPLPRRHTFREAFTGRKGWMMAAALTGVLVVEAALLGWLIWG